MEALDVAALREGALLLVDSAPIIYTLEGNKRFAALFAPLFQRHANSEVVLAVTTVTIAEVLTGPRVGQYVWAYSIGSLIEEVDKVIEAQDRKAA